MWEKCTTERYDLIVCGTKPSDAMWATKRASRFSVRGKGWRTASAQKRRKHLCRDWYDSRVEGARACARLPETLFSRLGKANVGAGGAVTL